MKIARLVMLAAALVLLPSVAGAQGKPAPPDAVLYFIWPQDGATIKGGFWCRFGLRNMGVTHAGDDFPNSGHHHLLIDSPLPPLDARRARTGARRGRQHREPKGHVWAIEKARL